MKTFMRFFAALGLGLIVLGMLAYASSRSLNFINHTLGADDQMTGFLALLASGPGALIWLAVFHYYADGIIQKGVSLLMIIVNTTAEFALFTADTLYVSGENGLTNALSMNEVRNFILAMNVFIALNILAGIVYSIGHMPKLMDFFKGLQKDILEMKALSKIDQESESLANELIPGIVDEWKSDFTKNYGSAKGLGLVNQSTPQRTPTTTGNLLDFRKWNLFNKNKKSSEANSQTISWSMPFPSQITFQVGEQQVTAGEKLQYAKTSDGYLLKRENGVNPFSRVSEDSLNQIINGENKQIPAPVDLNLNSNGAHANPPS